MWSSAGGHVWASHPLARSPSSLLSLHYHSFSLATYSPLTITHTSKPAARNPLVLLGGVCSASSARLCFARPGWVRRSLPGLPRRPPALGWVCKEMKELITTVYLNARARAGITLARSFFQLDTLTSGKDRDLWVYIGPNHHMWVCITTSSASHEWSIWICCGAQYTVSLLVAVGIQTGGVSMLMLSIYGMLA